jgi:hypothetical protein
MYLKVICKICKIIRRAQQLQLILSNPHIPPIQPTPHISTILHSLGLGLAGAELSYNTLRVTLSNGTIRAVMQDTMLMQHPGFQYLPQTSAQPVVLYIRELLQREVLSGGDRCCCCCHGFEGTTPHHRLNQCRSKTAARANQ